MGQKRREKKQRRQKDEVLKGCCGAFRFVEIWENAMWRPGKILKGCGYKNTMACTLRYKLPSRFHTDSVQVTNSQTDEFRKQKAAKQTHLNSPVALKTRRKKMNLEHEISTKGHRSRWLDILAANRDFRRPSTSRWACLKRKWGGGRVEVGWQKQKEEEEEEDLVNKTVMQVHIASLLFGLCFMFYVTLTLNLNWIHAP